MVLDVKTVGVDPGIAETLPERIADAISKHGGFDVANAREVRDMLALDKEKALLGCQDDTNCAVNIGRKLNADLIVSGSLGRVGASYVLSLSLIDSKDPNGTRKMSDTFVSMEALAKATPASVARLFGWTTTDEAAEAHSAFQAVRGKVVQYAVLDLKATGISVDEAKNLTEVVSSEVKTANGASVVSHDDIVAMLQLDKEKEQVGCTQDTACMLRIAGAMGVDRLIAGTVGKVADEFALSLSLIDTHRDVVENRHQESFRGNEDQLIGAVRHAVRKLLGLPETAVGKIAVTASHAPAEVFIDNERRGPLPLPPVPNITPGKHTVRLEKTGFLQWQGDFYVSPRETTVAWAELHPLPLAWYQQWWVWTIAGVVLAGAGGVTYFETTKPPKSGSGVIVWQP